MKRLAETLNKREKQTKRNFRQINKTKLELQQLRIRIRNLTQAYLIHKQPIQFILLEKYCLQRDQLKQQLKQLQQK